MEGEGHILISARSNKIYYKNDERKYHEKQKGRSENAEVKGNQEQDIGEIFEEIRIFYIFQYFILIINRYY